MREYLLAIIACVLCIALIAVGGFLLVWEQFRIDVPAYKCAILTHKTGIDISNSDEVAPQPKGGNYYKGVQQDMLLPGRYFYNPYIWNWKVIPQAEVETGQLAVLVRKSGDDLPYGEIIAWKANQKGIVPEVLIPGRYPINQWLYDVEIHSAVTVPAGFRGVKTLLAAPMPESDAAEVAQLAKLEEEYNKCCQPHTELEGQIRRLEVKIAARPVGVAKSDDLKELQRLNGEISVLASDPKLVKLGVDIKSLAEKVKAAGPNSLLVTDGKRGVQKTTYEEGKYFVNPYVTRINLVDCRSQRFNLGMNYDMGFPSKDGFWIVLDGVIEFRIDPEKAAKVFVTYNDTGNKNGLTDPLKEEIISKVIMPNARAFCRLRGANIIARDFIGGETRVEFQGDFEKAMREACEPAGVKIVVALITEIKPPQAIAKPIRDREVARQVQLQYVQEIVQQQSEKSLAIQKAKVLRKQALIGVEQKVVGIVFKAQEEQKVKVTKANERFAVAELHLEAAKDRAEAVVARGTAAAKVVDFDNQAKAAGWDLAVEAFGGSGNAYAKYVLHKKIAPGFRKIMANTADSPLMQIFKDMATDNVAAPSANRERNQQ